MGAREILIAVGVPAAAALLLLVGLAAVFGRGRRDAGEGGGVRLGWLVVLLIGAAAVVGSYAWQTRVDLWPTSATHRFPFVAGVAAAVGFAGVVLGRRRWATALAAGIGVSVVAWAFLSLLHESLMGVAARWGWIAACGVIGGVQAWVVESARERLAGWRWPAVLALVVGLSALGVTEAFANGPLVLGGAGAVLGAAAVAGLVGRRAVWGPGPGAATAVLLMGVLVFAHWFGDRERWLMFALVAAGPVATGVCLLPGVRGRGAMVRLAASAVAVLVVLGVQAGRALPPLMEAMRPPGEMDYEY